VGQTGKTVRPKIILPAASAGRFSTSWHAGLGCDYCINRDPNAPIFEVATLRNRRRPFPDRAGITNRILNSVMPNAAPIMRDDKMRTGGKTEWKQLGGSGLRLILGLTALAAGISSSVLAFDQTGITGARQRCAGPDDEEIVHAIMHFIIQSCQFKISVKRPGGHRAPVYGLGFLFFITYYFFFIIIASGLASRVEHNAVYIVYC